ncbi:MAG: lysophospholipid acyltransferase family protein [Thermoanaerobaculia bacterium]
MTAVDGTQSSRAPQRKQWKRRFVEWFAIHVFGGLILPLVIRSWRVEFDLPPHLKQLRDGHKVILAFWHNRQIGLIRVADELRPVKVLISRHGDGEIIARIVARFGIGSVRGSSTRGGKAAVRQLVSASRQSHLAITPDGPVGPRYQAKQGVALVAALTGLPITWISWSTDRAWRFKSWDRFILPKPFARIRYRVEGTVEIDRNAGAEEIEAGRLEIESRLNALTATLDREMGLED